MRMIFFFQFHYINIFGSVNSTLIMNAGVFVGIVSLCYYLLLGTSCSILLGIKPIYEDYICNMTLNNTNLLTKIINVDYITCPTFISTILIFISFLTFWYVMGSIMLLLGLNFRNAVYLIPYMCIIYADNVINIIIFCMVLIFLLMDGYFVSCIIFMFIFILYITMRNYIYYLIESEQYKIIVEKIN